MTFDIRCQVQGRRWKRAITLLLCSVVCNNRAVSARPSQNKVTNQEDALNHPTNNHPDIIPMLRQDSGHNFPSDPTINSNKEPIVAHGAHAHFTNKRATGMAHAPFGLRNDNNINSEFDKIGNTESNDNKQSENSTYIKEIQNNIRNDTDKNQTNLGEYSKNFRKPEKLDESPTSTQQFGNDTTNSNHSDTNPTNSHRFKDNLFGSNNPGSGQTNADNFREYSQGFVGNKLEKSGDSLNHEDIENDERIFKLKRRVGDRVDLNCDAVSAGVERRSKEHTVLALYLHFLSHSGCNPQDPVVTLIEWRYNGRATNNDNIYKHVSHKPKQWEFYGDGFGLDSTRTNIFTAQIGVIIKAITVKNSGTYRCDALLGFSNNITFARTKTGFMRLVVTGDQGSMPEYFHISGEDSIVSFDHDSSVIDPNENHREVGDPVDVFCTPRQLDPEKDIHSSTLSLLQIYFLPFYQVDSYFIKVASYDIEKDLFWSTSPRNRKWDISHVGVKSAKLGEMNNLGIHIHIKIQEAWLEDTGIFRCSFSFAEGEGALVMEAGLKVSKRPIQPGYCEPLNYKRVAESSDNDNWEMMLENFIDGNITITESPAESDQTDQPGEENTTGKEKLTIIEIIDEKFRELEIPITLKCRIAMGMLAFWILCLIILILRLIYKRCCARVEEHVEIIQVKKNKKIKVKKKVKKIKYKKKKKKKPRPVYIPPPEPEVEEDLPLFVATDLYWLEDRPCFPPSYIVGKTIPL